MTPANLPPRTTESDADPPPGLAVRRSTDRCFFAVEESVYDARGELEGYVVDGFLIPAEDVADVRTHGPTCGEQGNHGNADAEEGHA
ncbi:MAG: hypothetical protein AAF288_09955 [Planctomycetota bacterium]